MPPTVPVSEETPAVGEEWAIGAMATPIAAPTRKRLIARRQNVGVRTASAPVRPGIWVAERLLARTSLILGIGACQPMNSATAGETRAKVAEPGVRWSQA